MVRPGSIGVNSLDRNKLPLRVSYFLGYGQIDAIVQKWMDANPEDWHYAMSYLVLASMVDGCNLNKKKD
jgi:hypothetical protein